MMARILYGAGFDELKGSIGGMSFQRNRSGTIAKLKQMNRFSLSVHQSDRVNAFSALVSEWTALSAGDQDSWNTYALAHDKVNYWGETKTLTGFNWFMSNNSARVLCGLSVLTTPAAYVTPPVVPAYTVTCAQDRLRANFSPSWNFTAGYAFLFASPPVLSASQLNRKSLRLVRIVPPDTRANILFESPSVFYWSTYFRISWPPSTVAGSLKIITAISEMDTATGELGIFRTAITPITNP